MKTKLGQLGLLLGLSLAAAAVVSAPALLINLFEDSLGSEAQLVPWMWRLRAGLAYLPFVGSLAFLIWLFGRGKTWMADWSRRGRIATLVVLFLLSMIAPTAAFGAITITSDDFIFSTDQPSVSQKSPSGRRTAHVIYSCFFGCTLELAVEEPGALSMKKLRTPTPMAAKPDVTLPTIRWIDETKFQLIGGDPVFAQVVGGMTYP